jgi:hypothetical protein
MGDEVRARAVFAALAVAAGCAGCSSEMSIANSAEAQAGAGWKVTVYYTAVESYHSRDDLVAVTGCRVLDCSNGSDELGSYPRTFVKAVKDEGTGRITTGKQAGRYLNWSSGEGYWLDDAPRDSAGGALVPYRSAAADGVPAGRHVRIIDCGRNEDQEAQRRSCPVLRDATWEIRDEFTPGLGGERHIDLYIGEENAPDFTSGPSFTTFEDATLDLLPPA